MSEIQFGISLWSQATAWDEFLAAARLVDQLGYDSLWTDDHLYSDQGAADQSKFEAWTTLAAWAAVTERAKLGHLVVANTFRNPTVLAKIAVTVDHVSHGRCILGLGAGWFALEHEAFGIEFGRSAGERLDWMDEAASMLRPLLAGQTLDHAGPRYQAVNLTLYPPPVQARLPILIGGRGERKTLRSVAKYADFWHAPSMPLEELQRKTEVLHRHCEEVGRDPAEIQIVFSPPTFLIVREDRAKARRVYQETLAYNRTPADRYGDAAWWGSPEQLAGYFQPYIDAGVRSFILDVLAPYDRETIERFIGEVKPLLS
jgi:alkanesulfonate monooxygenase SsuD/methylene tetrahydromethanopterin reductase-like flavin-dependent oxidoreductase (luciferase family)